MASFILDNAAVRQATAGARRHANGLSGPNKQRALELCNEIESLSDELADLERRGLVCFFIFMVFSPL